MSLLDLGASQSWVPKPEILQSLLTQYGFQGDVLNASGQLSNRAYDYCNALAQDYDPRNGPVPDEKTFSDGDIVGQLTEEHVRQFIIHVHDEKRRRSFCGHLAVSRPSLFLAKPGSMSRLSREEKYEEMRRMRSLFEAGAPDWRVLTAAEVYCKIAYAMDDMSPQFCCQEAAALFVAMPGTSREAIYSSAPYLLRAFECVFKPSLQRDFLEILHETNRASGARELFQGVFRERKALGKDEAWELVNQLRLIAANPSPSTTISEVASLIESSLGDGSPVTPLVLMNTGGWPAALRQFFMGNPENRRFPFAYNSLTRSHLANSVGRLLQQRLDRLTLMIPLSPQTMASLMQRHPDLLDRSQGYFTVQAGRIEEFRDFLRQNRIPVRILVPDRTFSGSSALDLLELAADPQIDLLFLSPADGRASRKAQRDRWVEEAMSDLESFVPDSV